MATKGYFIAAIIDDLSDLSGRIAVSDRMALTSINTLVENFFRMVLNRVCGLQLENLNLETSNYPGLDLGDAAAGRAFQVSAQRNSRKINDTLETLARHGVGPYKKIIVLVTGTRQKTYDLDKDLCRQLDFSADDIWDIVDICKRAMDLPIHKLRDLHKNIRQELQPVLIEFEVPDGDGNYPTNLIDDFDQILKPKVGDVPRITAFFEEEGLIDHVKPREVIEALADRLSRLPRLTRELLGIIVDRREVMRIDRASKAEQIEINVDRLTASIPKADLDRHIRVLRADGFLSKNVEWGRDENQRWQVDLAGKAFESEAGIFNSYLKIFLDKEQIGMREFFVGLNFEKL